MSFCRDIRQRKFSRVLEMIYFDRLSGLLLVVIFTAAQVIGTIEIGGQKWLIGEEIRKHELDIANGRTPENPAIITPPIAYASKEPIHDVSPFIIWDPIWSFKEAFQQFCCPSCQLLDMRKSPMVATSIWNDGSTRQRAPRIIYDTSQQVMLVSRVYRCTVNKQHIIIATHPSIMEQIKKCGITVLFELTHQYGYTHALAETLCSVIDSGVSFRQMEEIMKRNYDHRYVSGHRHPSHDYLEDIYVNHIYARESEYKEQMCRTSAKWISADHTFKSVMNIGYTGEIEKKWVKLYNSIFCIMNEKGHILKWQFTKSTKANEVQSLFKELAERLKSNNKEIEAIYVDNCCLLRDKLQIFFNDKDLKIKLDLFHAINRFASTISQRHPMKQRLMRDYRNVFRSYGDYGKKRRTNTPDSDKLQQNLRIFKRKWTRMRYNGRIILTKKSMKALTNIEMHIQRGCLSDIPPGAGTNKNERMHRTLRKVTKRNRLGVHLAYALFLRTFYQINIARGKGEELQLPQGWSESFGFPPENYSEDSNVNVTSGATSNDIEKLVARAKLITALYNNAIFRGFNENYDNLLHGVTTFQGKREKDFMSKEESAAVMSERALGMNFDITNIQGDGNCFFMTLAFQVSNMMQNAPPMIEHHLTCLGVFEHTNLNGLAQLLRKLIVQEWLRHPERYESAFDNSANFREEAERFLKSGHYSSSLGDAMPLSAANVLQMPLVILTSVVNWPLVIITPQNSITDVPLYLAYTQEGEGHYDALTEIAIVNKENQKKIRKNESASCRCGVNYKGTKTEKLFCSKNVKQGMGKRKYSSRCICLKNGLQCGSKCRCKRCGNGKVKISEDIRTKRKTTKKFFKHKSFFNSREKAVFFMTSRGEQRKTNSFTVIEIFILEICLLSISKRNLSLQALHEQYNACIRFFNSNNNCQLPERSEEEIRSKVNRRQKVLGDL